mgnify:CR=1 FL=1
MDNPLSEEQIKKITAISKLPAEQQQVELQAFLKTLNPEQMEFLKQQQGGGCLFCSIVEGNVDAKKIYEDDLVIAVLDINPATKGHTLLFPKKHFSILAQLSEELNNHLFTVANKISAVLFDTLKAEGTNLHVANGSAAGQHVPHVLIHVIPRYKNDGVLFQWDGKKLSPEDMDAVCNDLQGKVVLPKKIQEQEQPQEIKKEDVADEERCP